MLTEQKFSSIPGPDRWKGLGTTPLTPDEEIRITTYIQSLYGNRSEPADKTTKSEPPSTESE